MEVAYRPLIVNLYIRMFSKLIAAVLIICSASPILARPAPAYSPAVYVHHSRAASSPSTILISFVLSDSAIREAPIDFEPSMVVLRRQIASVWAPKSQNGAKMGWDAGASFGSSMPTVKTSNFHSLSDAYGVKAIRYDISQRGL